MSEYLRFWFAKVAVELGTTLAIFAVIALAFVVYMGFWHMTSPYGWRRRRRK